MIEKLQSILLIDDDEPTNFLHELVIKQANCTEECIVMSGGQKALEFLSEGSTPDLILLDINMPAMNGWEFLESYQSLNIPQKEQIIIVMLTTSLNSDEEEKAKTFQEVREFRRKPLTNTILHEIIENHFHKT